MDKIGANDFIGEVILDLPLELGAVGGWEAAGEGTPGVELTRALSDPHKRVESKLVRSRLAEMIESNAEEEDDAGAGTITLRHIYGTLILGLEFKSH